MPFVLSLHCKIAFFKVTMLRSNTIVNIPTMSATRILKSIWLYENFAMLVRYFILTNY